jgi:hypothetical protein
MAAGPDVFGINLLNSDLDEICQKCCLDRLLAANLSVIASSSFQD